MNIFFNLQASGLRKMPLLTIFSQMLNKLYYPDN
jgi:hypothetical protein